MNDTRKPVRRRTVQQHRRRRIVVTVGPGDVIGFRQERTRKTNSYAAGDYLRCKACFEAKRVEQRKARLQGSAS